MVSSPQDKKLSNSLLLFLNSLNIFEFVACFNLRIQMIERSCLIIFGDVGIEIYW